MIDVPRLFAFSLAIIITLIVLLFLKKTDTGKSIRAAADNRTGALLVGTDVNKVYAICFGIGTACVGAAGGLLVLSHASLAAYRGAFYVGLFYYRHLGWHGQPDRCPGGRIDHRSG